MGKSSDLYQRSRFEKYRKFFMQSSEIVQSYATYSIKEKTCEASPAAKPWENGRGGVPVFWDPDTKLVYCDAADNHTLVIGPTGSKKSRLVAMPQVRILGAEKENIIITDPKAEIYCRTASYLKSQGYDIRVLNLRSPSEGDSWNPLLVPFHYYCVGDIDRAYEFANDVAQNLMHDIVNKNVDPFWENSAASFFFGLTILLFKYCQDMNLGSSYVTISNIIALSQELLSKKMPPVLWDYAKKDPFIYANLVGTIEAPSDTRASIVSVFSEKIRLFSIQPNLMDMLSSNSFELDNLDNIPTAIFLILPDEKTSYHGIGSLFVKQSYEYLIYMAQKKSRNVKDAAALGRRMNYIIDEFASMPTIHDFPALITAARSRNIRFTLITQSKHQLMQRYSDETDTIMSNCANWIILTCREHSFLEEVSSLCGRTYGNMSEPIVHPDSIQRLNKDTGEALLLAGRNRPFVTHLPDIEVYDNNEFCHIPIEKKKRTKGKSIEKLLQKDREKHFSDHKRIIEEIRKSSRLFSEEEL